MSTELQATVPHKGLSAIGVYNLIAVILFVLTVTEVGILYPPLSGMPETLKVFLLLGISVAKYVTVVAFFMHLFYDSPICTVLFSMGMFIAIGTVVVLMHVLPEAESPLPVRSHEAIQKSLEGKTSFHEFHLRNLRSAA